MSHTKKKRECHRIFFWPRPFLYSLSRYSSASRFHFHAWFIWRDPPFQLKTFHAAWLIHRKDSGPSFCSFNGKLTCWREIWRFMGSLNRALSSERDSGWKFYCFRKWRRSWWKQPCFFNHSYNDYNNHDCKLVSNFDL